LIELVRSLGLVGTKLSCDSQVCGACTVLLDGRPVSSCTTLAIEADDKPVVTIEGLADGAKLHPLQEAFIERFAFQCGYCKPGMAYAAVVRSTRAHAKITGIDRTAAAASPGVIRVLIGDDLLAAGLTPYYGHVVLDHPVLAIERVRFHGEPVAVVVAETKREAAEAAELVDVSYDDLRAVIDADEALKPDAPVLHERRGERVGDEGMDEGEKGLVGNVCAIARVEWGNIEEALARAHLVVEGEYRYPMLYGYAMEPYNALGLSAHPRALGVHCGREAARARLPDRHEQRRIHRQHAACELQDRKPLLRPLSHSGAARCRALRVHQHRSLELIARVRRAAGKHRGRAADGRGGGEARHRSGRAAAPQPRRAWRGVHAR